MNFWNKIKWGLAAIVFLALLGMAQKSDYTEAVLTDMPTVTYKAMSDALPELSDAEIARMYVDNEEYWDQYAENYEKREEW